jgi:hypothetical protein
MMLRRITHVSLFDSRATSTVLALPLLDELLARESLVVGHLERLLRVVAQDAVAWVDLVVALEVGQVRRIRPDRLVFIDESWLSVTMSRSHAWVRRGEEFIDRVPMNRGKNLTLLGAIRRKGWVLLSTQWQTTNGDRFVPGLQRSCFRSFIPATSSSWITYLLTITRASHRLARLAVCSSSTNLRIPRISIRSSPPGHCRNNTSASTRLALMTPSAELRGAPATA